MPTCWRARAERSAKAAHFKFDWRNPLASELFVPVDYRVADQWKIEISIRLNPSEAFMSARLLVPLMLTLHQQRSASARQADVR